MELLVDELNHVDMSGAVLWDGNLKQDFLFKAKLFATVCDWPGEPYPVWLTEIRLPVRRSVRAARVRSPWWCEGLLPLRHARQIRAQAAQDGTSQFGSYRRFLAFISVR